MANDTKIRKGYWLMATQMGVPVPSESALTKFIEDQRASFTPLMKMIIAQDPEREDNVPAVRLASTLSANSAQNRDQNFERAKDIVNGYSSLGLTLTGNEKFDDAQNALKMLDKQKNNPAMKEVWKQYGTNILNLGQQQFDRKVDITSGLMRNGLPVNQENIDKFDKQFTRSSDVDGGKKGDLLPISQDSLDRRIKLTNLGYDTSTMVPRQVDQTWDTKSAWEQANPGKPATQADISKYSGAASADGTKDVNLGSTTAKIKATQVVEGTGGGNGPTGNGTPPLGGSGGGPGPGQPGNLGVTPGSATTGAENPATPATPGTPAVGTPGTPGYVPATPGTPASPAYTTGLGQTTAAVNQDTVKTTLGNLNTFFPEFTSRQADLGKFASGLAADLASGNVPDSFKRGFAENIRSAQGVRGLGASPLAAFDEAIGMSGATQRYQGNQLSLLGNTQNIMGAPLSAPGGYGDVAQLGQNLVANDQRNVALGQNQQQIDLGAANSVLDRAEFTEGMDAYKNRPKPNFWENLGTSVLGGVVGGFNPLRNVTF